MCDTDTSTLSAQRSSMLHSSDSGGSFSSQSSYNRFRSPRHSETSQNFFVSNSESRRPHKRIIVLCDGTWENGVDDPSKQNSSYTNVLRLARSIHHEDNRRKDQHPITQVVYYQSGIGSEHNVYARYIEGTTGESLPHKVEDAYAFIAHNYNPGDDIFLFGFSRGAYTARMIAMFIGEIGILTRKDMDQFHDILMKFQKLGICTDSDKKKTLEKYLEPWRSPDSEGRKRASHGKDKFTVKCVGVWDTVGSLGLPHEVDPIRREKQKLFGFPDCQLGEHIEAAYHALAIHEMREDFVCTKFIQTPAGKAKGQILKQTWFSGCHADVGGGYPIHNLSDISLVWMAANVEDQLLIDIDYLTHGITPVAPWGTQVPHNSRTGVFELTFKTRRALPTAPNPDTNETIHSSVLVQLQNKAAAKELEGLAASVKEHKSLVAKPMELEKMIQATWEANYRPDSTKTIAYKTSLEHSAPVELAINAASICSTLLRWLPNYKFLKKHTWLGRTTTALVALQPADCSETDQIWKWGIATTSTSVTVDQKSGKTEAVRVDTTVVSSTTVVVHSPASSISGGVQH